LGGGTIVFGIDEDAGYKITGVYDAQGEAESDKNVEEYTNRGD